MGGPLPYHIYVKSPKSKRFGRTTVDGFENYAQAIDAISYLVEFNRAAIGTKYQIRQGRRIVFSITKFKEENIENKYKRI